MANPQDFVALEQFRRSMATEHPEVELQGSQHTDEELQALVAGIIESTGADPLETGSAGGVGQGALYDPTLAGTGYAGVNIPGAGAYNRAGFRQLTPQQRAILASFLQAGVETEGGADISLDPDEYFADIERSFVPVLPGVETRTQYKF
jgi:hypothetical protein